MPSDKFRQKNPKNKQTKFQLVFDEDSRKDFLTGFQKRKKARKKIAQQEAEAKRNKERREEKQKRREALEEELKSIRLPEADPALSTKKKAVVIDHPEHTVTVTSVTSLDLKKEHGGIGDNKVDYDVDDEDIMDEGDDDSEDDLSDSEPNGEADDGGDDDVDDDVNDDGEESGDGKDPKEKPTQKDDLKIKKKAMCDKRRQHLRKQTMKRRKGASQATIRKMKSMKRKSLGKFIRRGSGKSANPRR